MAKQSIIKADDLQDKRLNLTALENDRKQLREETLEWLSISALSKLRVAWGG
jgi:hypothetical protein